jgi:type IX secretion system substrate protein
MKKILLIFISVFVFASVSNSQIMNCGSFCILNITNLDDSDTNNVMLDVIVYNGDTNSVNYPTIVVVNSLGDTVANINNMFFFFLHGANDTMTHTIPTTLDSIPAGFTGTVYITDQIYDTTCSYSYPMSCTVGINEYAAVNEMKIFPNPASDIINIDLGELKNRTAAITLYDATGKAVKNITTANRNVVLERGNLRSGIYFIDVIIDNKRFSKKIILE